MLLSTLHDSVASFFGSAAEFYVFFRDCRYTKVQPPGVTGPILQMHSRINVYIFKTNGVWSATADSGVLYFSIPVVDEEDVECSSHPD